jgi:hypothetical protein
MPGFNRKMKCVISDRPKFKPDNVVFRSDGRRIVVERVLERGKRMAQPWPANLTLVVRGPAAKRITRYLNKITSKAQQTQQTNG